jgi:O-antigen/teichoic acid export membrane protein
MYDGLYTMALRLATTGFALALGVLTARMLGPAGRGIYALPGVYAGLVTSAFGGLSSANSYFLLNRKPSWHFFWIMLAGSALWSIAAAALVVPLSLLSSERWVAVPAILAVPALAALNLAAGYVLGVKKVRLSSGIAALQGFLTLCAVAAALVLVGKLPSAAIGAWIVSINVAGFAVLAYVAVDARRRLNGADRVTFGEYLRFSWHVSLTFVVTLVNYRADLYILALYLPVADLGLYSLAVSGAESLLLPTRTAATVASPHIGSMALREAALVTARCVRNNLLISLALCGILFVVAAPLVRALYGKAFLPLVPPFDILLIGVVALSLGSPVSTYFTLRLGKPQVAMWFSSVSAVVCIGLTLALIGRYGMIGAAIGSAAGYIAGQALGLAYFSRSAALNARVFLIPTVGDLQAYASFASRILRDGRNFLRPAP